MSVWIIYEEMYTVWTEEQVAELEVFASEELALARILELCRQEAEERLGWTLRENPAYVAKSYEARIEKLRKGETQPQWYDVGMVADENGVEVWTTRQRTVDEEVALLEAQMANDIKRRADDRDARIADLRAQLSGQKGIDRGEWKVMEKEVVGG